jgi:RNA polymerase sigma factor (sigma-70 family)
MAELPELSIDVREETFEAFYERAHAVVFRALTVTLRDRSLAADATQEAFARALARWADVADYGNPEGWVFRVGLNWARSWLRRTAREVIGGLDRTAADLPDPPDPAVAEALERLPIDQRAVLVLRFVWDWPIERVARTLAVPVGTAKSRQHRALRTLQQLLEEHHGR